MMKNILITSAGKRVVLVKIFQKTLQEMGIDAKVYTVDLKPEMAPAGYVSEACIRVPRCTADDYMDALLQICLDKHIGVVIPTIDTELKVLAENRLRFQEQGIQIVISDLAFITTCRDKRLTDALFHQLDIPAPRIMDRDQVTFPLFAKPYDGSLSANTHIVRHQEEPHQRHPQRSEDASAGICRHEGVQGVHGRHVLWSGWSGEGHRAP